MTEWGDPAAPEWQDILRGLAQAPGNKGGDHAMVGLWVIGVLAAAGAAFLVILAAIGSAARFDHRWPEPERGPKRTRRRP